MSSKREGLSGLTENRDWRYQDRDDPQITQMTQITEGTLGRDTFDGIQ